MEKPALFYRKIEDKKVICNLCSHHCTIVPDKLGLCKVRQNKDGILYTLVYGELIAANVDPIEKKPIYHLLPGSKSFSIATVGCNFQCGFCQNWQISQASGANLQRLTEDFIRPENLVGQARDSGCKSISYTYTEPTIYFEYAFDVAKIAKEKRLKNIFVTNGFMTKEVLKEISPYLDAANVDLKSFNDEFYKKICKSKLQPVLDSIKLMRELGIWVEITTLIIPEENDSDEELFKIADFIAKTGKEIPWHVNRFHPDYKFLDHRATNADTLEKAFKIGKSAGLKYVYIGNTVREGNTYCHACNNLLIGRGSFSVLSNNIIKGKCPACKTDVDGVWE